jgi:hypothetical protein
MRIGVTVAAIAAAWISLGATYGWAKAPKINPDDGVFTYYQTNSDGSVVSFEVCGTAGGGTGCFGTGYFSPLEHACGVLEGRTKWNGNVGRRAIYVLDKRASSDSPLLLYVYQRSDRASDTDYNVKLKLKQTITLNIDGLTGGPNSHCSMAASDNFIYAGTDTGLAAAKIGKADLLFTPIRGIGGGVVSITADARGWVAVSFVGGFDIFDPEGNSNTDGGGLVDMVNTREAWKPD